jgi:hypothetical protein
MNKKYQAFVSSTYQDLLEERQEVMQALLELDCIPVGMELFPAADDDQWTLIKGLIADCDYYILIVGGRYGSVGPEGKSYTQMEYEYAVSLEIPIISFLPKDPDKIEVGKTEKKADGKENLLKFKELVQQKMCRFWTNPSDLGSQVSRSLVKLIKSNPRPGWVKADKLLSEHATKELLELREKVLLQEKELNKSKSDAPTGTSDFMQGNDIFEINFTYRYYKNGSGYQDGSSSVKVTWSSLLYELSPLMVDESNEPKLKLALNNYIFELEKNKLFKSLKKRDLTSLQIVDSEFQTIKIQFRALGLIERSDKKRSIKDTSTYWTLTPYGDFQMIKLRALKR